MTMEYHAGVKKIKVNLNVGAWKVPQSTLLSKNSKPQCNISNIILLPKHEITGYISQLLIHIYKSEVNKRPIKSQIVNVFSFEHHTVCIITPQLCPYSVKEAIDDT